MKYALCEEILINVTPPTNVSEPPLMKAVNLYSTPEVDWRESLIEDDEINELIYRVNGAHLANDHLMPFCDYCHTDCVVPYNMYCNTCHEDMCSICYTKKERVRLSGNGTKVPEICRDCHPMTRYEPSLKEAKCDVCKRRISPKKIHLSYSNRTKDRDVCGKCADTDTGRQFISKHKLVRTIPYYDQTGLGSLLDWVCILEGSDSMTYGDMILYNVNIDSPSHGMFACSTVDSHGRRLIFTFPPEYQDIDKIHSALVNDKKSIQCDVDEFYTGPLKVLMSSLNMPVCLY